MKCIKSTLVVLACFAMNASFADQLKIFTVSAKDGNSISISLQSDKSVKLSGQKILAGKNKEIESVSGGAKIEFEFDGRPVVIAGDKIVVK